MIKHFDPQAADNDRYVYHRIQSGCLQIGITDAVGTWLFTLVSFDDGGVTRMPLKDDEVQQTREAGVAVVDEGGVKMVKLDEEF